MVDDVYAFVALDNDWQLTIKGITYDQETRRGWAVVEASWRQLDGSDKQLFDDNGQPAIRVVKAKARQGTYTGWWPVSATLTSGGVQHTFDFWLGEHSFEAF